jgi:hypothetical protein
MEKLIGPNNGQSEARLKVLPTTYGHFLPLPEAEFSDVLGQMS